jgi:hypothetical protein
MRCYHTVGSASAHECTQALQDADIEALDGYRPTAALKLEVIHPLPTLALKRTCG